MRNRDDNDMGPITMNADSSVSFSMAAQLLIWVVAGVATYGVVSARVAVLESNNAQLERRLERIEKSGDDTQALLRQLTIYMQQRDGAR